MTSALPTVATLPAHSIAAPQEDGLAGWILSLITSMGEAGVGLALAIETLFPPIPSELILPVAGYLSHSGELNFWLALLCATAGAMVSGWISYYVGALIGRDRTRRLFEKVPLFDVADFDRAERVFARWGAVAVLVGRCIPLVRSFVSIPAGIERMPLWQFSLYTLIGSFTWNAIWIGLGYAFGPQIEHILNSYSGLVTSAILAITGALLVWFVVSRSVRLRRSRRLVTESE